MNQSAQMSACLECLTEEGLTCATRDGLPLCARCAGEYYVACAECRGLVAEEETAIRDGLHYCLDCLARLADPGAEPLDEEQIAALAREFVELQAQVKPLNDRLEAIKERLKRIAAGRPREGSAVLLGEGDAMVKCGFSVRASFDAERLLALEAEVGEDLINTLFDRKITFSANKESLGRFLADDDPQYAAARAAIKEATEMKEIQTLGLAATKRKGKRE